MTTTKNSFDPDGWSVLKRLTKARIALGRSGGSLPTGEWLDFRLAHARARDAVWRPLDLAALEQDLSALNKVVAANSAAATQEAFLRRPDLGRQLDPSSSDALRRLGASNPKADLVIVLSRGLSSTAVEQQAMPLLRELLPRLAADRFGLAPFVVVPFGRVAIADEIGEAFGAKAALILIGERPGLASPASLGAYLTFGPRRGRSDAERNCVSNIHADGLQHAAAAAKIAWLVREALRLGLSGVGLKDESDAALVGGASSLAVGAVGDVSLIKADPRFGDGQ